MDQNNNLIIHIFASLNILNKFCWWNKNAKWLSLLEYQIITYFFSPHMKKLQYSKIIKYVKIFNFITMNIDFTGVMNNLWFAIARYVYSCFSVIVNILCACVYIWSSFVQKNKKVKLFEYNGKIGSIVCISPLVLCKHKSVIVTFFLSFC